MISPSIKGQQVANPEWRIEGQNCADPDLLIFYSPLLLSHGMLRKNLSNLSFRGAAGVEESRNSRGFRSEIPGAVYPELLRCTQDGFAAEERTGSE
jgi:hypothetical protein